MADMQEHTAIIIIIFFNNIEEMFLLPFLNVLFVIFILYAFLCLLFFSFLLCSFFLNKKFVCWCKLTLFMCTRLFHTFYLLISCYSVNVTLIAYMGCFFNYIKTKTYQENFTMTQNTTQVSCHAHLTISQSFVISCPFFSITFSILLDQSNNSTS